jgi:hypothetical protein
LRLICERGDFHRTIAKAAATGILLACQLRHGCSCAYLQHLPSSYLPSSTLTSSTTSSLESEARSRSFLPPLPPRPFSRTRAYFLPATLLHNWEAPLSHLRRCSSAHGSSNKNLIMNHTTRGCSPHRMQFQSADSYTHLAQSLPHVTTSLYACQIPCYWLHSQNCH